MKTRKINLKWQRVLVGVVLCAVLAVFVASKVADTQVVTGSNSQARVLQRAANLNDVWEKMNAMDERLVRIEQKIDALNQEMEVALRVLKRLDRESK
jgi:TolA-binding protein